MNKLRKFLIKSLGGELPKKEKTLADREAEYYDQQKALEDNYLFDFQNWASDYYRGGGTRLQSENPSSDMPKKIKIKPIDVLNELETIPTPWSLALLNDKIEMLKEKEKHIVQHYAKREIKALIERLENRKKYIDHKEFFERFQNTNDEKINNLLEKYELVKNTSDIFVPEFPSEAIKVMSEYTEKCMEICGKKPLFYVIATEDSFKQTFGRRDPILLVQSPFGFYWQVLGAWDKEMLILGEL